MPAWVHDPFHTRRRQAGQAGAVPFACTAEVRRMQYFHFGINQTREFTPKDRRLVNREDDIETFRFFTGTKQLVFLFYALKSSLLPACNNKHQTQGPGRSSVMPHADEHRCARRTLRENPTQRVSTCFVTYITPTLATHRTCVQCSDFAFGSTSSAGYDVSHTQWMKRVILKQIIKAGM